MKPEKLKKNSRNKSRQQQHTYCWEKSQLTEIVITNLDELTTEEEVKDALKNKAEILQEEEKDKVKMIAMSNGNRKAIVKINTDCAKKTIEIGNLK